MGKTGVISNKKLCRGKVFGCVKDKITQIPVLWVLRKIECSDTIQMMKKVEKVRSFFVL